MKGSVAGLVVAAVCVAVWCERATRPLPPIEVCFSPKGGCTEAIVKEVDAARSSLLVQAYSFTSAPIAEAVAAAHRRGVRVEVILDSSKMAENSSSENLLHNAGVAVLIDSRHAIAHNKVIVIDDAVVLTGSFNFSKSAEESNAENLLIVRDQVLAQQYTENWKAHAAHSEPYAGRNEEASPHATPRHKGVY